MNRRKFLETIPLSAVPISALSKADFSAVPSQAKGPAQASSSLPPGVRYFTEEALRNLVDTSLPLDGIKFETVAYNFPNYHPSPAQERYFGKGWTEWDVLRRAKSYFPGHLQPKYPLWGYYNEADPAWAEREIDAASSHGINAFMIDWFWYNGTQILQEQLEQGFLRARNCEKMRFAVMWANVDWPNQYPAPASAKGSPGRCAHLYKQTYSDSDMDRIVDYWIEHYLRKRNYWRIREIPVIGIYNPKGLLKAYSPEKIRSIFDRMRDRAAKAGVNGIHFQASQIYQAGKTPLKECGYDSATHYHTFAFFPIGTREYVDGIEASIRLWKDSSARVGMPYFPDCPVGLDNSSRYGKDAYFFLHRTPDQYALFLQAAKYFLAANKTSPATVFLSSWNEWTEDHNLAPDAYYGYGYMEAVRNQFAK